MSSPPDTFDPVAVSKTIAYFLRHNPQAADLALDPNGWTDFEALVGALRRTFPVSAEDVVAIVQSDPKHRYAIDGGRIRANQGHSVAIDLDLAPSAPPDRLYHGTIARFLDDIRERGLVKGSRAHVHLSPNVETAHIVASRRRGQVPVVLAIYAARMAAAGYLFFRSENGVWLTDHVPHDFFSVLTDRPGPTGAAT